MITGRYREAMQENDPRLIAAHADVHSLSALVHQYNQKWWHDVETGEPIERNVGELLMLVVTELAEACEGDRKNLMDDKLPHRNMFEVEIADAIIRLLDVGAGKKLDVAGAFAEKMAYNAMRYDHTHEARKQAHGKRY